MNYKIYDKKGYPIFLYNDIVKASFIYKYSGNYKKRYTICVGGAFNAFYYYEEEKLDNEYTILFGLETEIYKDQEKSRIWTSDPKSKIKKQCDYNFKTDSLLVKYKLEITPQKFQILNYNGKSEINFTLSDKEFNIIREKYERAKKRAGIKP